jgi:hypothetical protein
MPCDLQAFAVVSALAWSLPTSSVKATIIAFRRGVPVRTGRAFSAATRMNLVSMCLAASRSRCLCTTSHAGLER